MARLAKRLLPLALLACTPAFAADVVLVNGDPAGSGLNDPTARDPEGLNPGTTLGEQRRIAYQFAADLWGAVLESTRTIYVGGSFQALSCNATSAVLGSAGATYNVRDFTGAPQAATWYPAALADNLANADFAPNTIDIVSFFNSNLGTPGCLTSSGGWYYGLDGNTPAGKINFLNVVLHEIGHGLGFAGRTASNGAFASGFKDIYSTYAYDNVLGKAYPNMTQAERAAAIVAGGRTVWSGSEVNRQAALTLDRGRTDLRITAPAGAAGSFDFTGAAFGTPATTANFSGTIVQALDAANAGGPSTTDACTALTNAADVAGRIALVDRGTCGFAVKAAVVQAAGAVGMVVANTATSAFGTMGGADPLVTIPSVMVRHAAGVQLKANLPAQGGLFFSADKLVGADDAGRVRLYAPSPYEGGSSFSHFDTFLGPNALMEPAITGTLRGDVNIDLTPALFQDIGWTLNPGTARIGNCATNVDVVGDGGLIPGANVQAWSNLCVYGATTKGEYQSCMDDYKERALASGLLVGNQGGKVMACAARILK